MRRFLAAFFGGVASMYLNLLVSLYFFVKWSNHTFLILHLIDVSRKKFEKKNKGL